MAMIPWNLPAKPAAPVADQLYVDDKRQVWQWDATSQAWMHRPQMYLQEIEHMSLYTWLRSWFNWVRDMYPPHLFPQWANLYSKTFCEFSFPITGTPTVYYSHPTALETDLRAVVRNNTPHGGLYTDECNVRIMQVVDPNLDVAKTSQHNLIYSMFRGRESFNRKHGRAMSGDPPTSGYPDQFQNGFPVEFWVQFMQQFWGITPGVVPLVGRQIVWSHVNKSLFRQPREGSIINSGNQGRYAWDVGTASVVLPPNNTEFVIGAPKILYSSFYGLGTRTLSAANIFRGAEYLSSRSTAMMVYPLVRQLPNLQYAFYCKPLGVDSFGFGYDPFSTPMRLVVEFVYKDGHVRRRMVDHTAAYSRGYFDNADVVTGFDIRMLAVLTTLGLRAAAEEIPEFFQFYLLDSATGRRSKTIGQKYKVVRHKCHITTCIEPMRNG